MKLKAGIATKTTDNVYRLSVKSRVFDTLEVGHKAMIEAIKAGIETVIVEKERLNNIKGGSKMKLEQRMENILWKYTVKEPKGKYLQALNRLVKAGVATKTADNVYRLSVKTRVV